MPDFTLDIFNSHKCHEIEPQEDFFTLQHRSKLCTLSYVRSLPPDPQNPYYLLKAFTIYMHPLQIKFTEKLIPLSKGSNIYDLTSNR